jgi:hypothetical protein
MTDAFIAYIAQIDITDFFFADMSADIDISDIFLPI